MGRNSVLTFRLIYLGSAIIYLGSAIVAIPTNHFQMFYRIVFLTQMLLYWSVATFGMYENQSSANSTCITHRKEIKLVASLAWPTASIYRHLNSKKYSTEYDNIDHISRKWLYHIPFRHIAIFKLYKFLII